MEDKRGGWFFWALMGVVLLFIGMLFFYFAMFKPARINSEFEKTLANPASNLTNEQVVEVFDERFVQYLLYSIKAYELHNPPLSSDTPKMEIVAGEDVYNAVIIDGVIEVGKGPLKNKDIVIKTSKIEVAKMLKDQDYVTKSFFEGMSTIDLVAGKTNLFAKGYLNLYTQLTGKSITGNVIRIYLG